MKLRPVGHHTGFNILCILIAVCVLGLIAGSACNKMVKDWGGTMTLTIPKNSQIINAEWKENNLWVLTRDTITGVYTYNEHSSKGISDGKVKFKSDD